MGMATPTGWPSTASYGNYGPPIKLRRWRKLQWPMHPPDCVRTCREVKRLGWNRWRCSSHGTLVSERMYHRLLLWRNPFRQESDPHPLLYLLGKLR